MKMAEAFNKDDCEIIYAGSSLILSEAGQVLVQNKTSGDLIYVNYFDLFPDQNDDQHMEIQEQVHNLDEQVVDEEDDDHDQNTEASSIEASSSTLQNCKKWTDEETLLLIRTIETNLSYFDTNLKKNVYDNIAKELSKILKQKISGQQVDTKWKGLKIMYKKIKQHNETSGNAPKKWKFFNAIDEFLSKKPEINPLAIASSSSDTLTVTVTPTSKPKKIKEDDVERRHKERMQRQDRFLDLFEKLLNRDTQK